MQNILQQFYEFYGITEEQIINEYLSQHRIIIMCSAIFSIISLLGLIIGIYKYSKDTFEENWIVVAVIFGIILIVSLILLMGTAGEYYDCINNSNVAIQYWLHNIKFTF